MSQKAQPLQNGNADQVVIDWDRIKKLDQSALFEFYSHTVTHRRAATIERNELLSELKDSRLCLEKNLGKPCPYLCWPYGSFTEESEALAVEAGYEALFTTIEGFISKGANRLRMNRCEVRDDLACFKELLLSASS